MAFKAISEWIDDVGTTADLRGVDLAKRTKRLAHEIPSTLACCKTASIFWIWRRAASTVERASEAGKADGQLCVLRSLPSGRIGMTVVKSGDPNQKCGEDVVSAVRSKNCSIVGLPCLGHSDWSSSAKAGPCQ